MAKASGWANWKAQFRGNHRARDRGLPGKSKSSLGSFAESSTGPVARELWDQQLIEYNNQAEIEVNKASTKAAAQRLMKDSQDATYPKKYIVQAYQESIAARGGNISERAAENQINRDQAAKARAILAAADVGQVKLTDAQERRLREIEQGNYLDLVYNQHKSGDRGTLIGVGDRFAKTKLNTSVERREKRRQFFQDLAESRPGAARVA